MSILVRNRCQMKLEIVIIIVKDQYWLVVIVNNGQRKKYNRQIMRGRIMDGWMERGQLIVLTNVPRLSLSI